MVALVVKEQRLKYIADVMAAQKLEGKPNKYVVLRDWNRIVDWDRDYTIQMPELPPAPFLPAGTNVWVVERADDPGLVRASVVEDRMDGVFVKLVSHPVQLLIPRDLVKQTPIPLRPLAVRRKHLDLYLGEELARRWHSARAIRLKEPNVQGN